MNDHQFALEGVEFGLHLPVAASGFDTGEDSIEATDGFQRYTSSRTFGRDARQPSDWSWDLHTDTSVDAATALEDMRSLTALWRETIDEPGPVRELRYQIAGRERSVFGRPGQWTDNLDGLHYGLVTAQATFRRADALFYDSAVRSEQMTLLPAVDGGLTFPMTFPLTTLESSPRGGALDANAVGGDRPAPMLVTFAAGSAALVNPSIAGESWRIALNYSLAPGEVVTVSTYPWDLGVRKSSGAYMNGALTVDSRLSKARLKHTGEALVFDGVDSSGTSTCTVAWRPTHSTI